MPNHAGALELVGVAPPHKGFVYWHEPGSQRFTGAGVVVLCVLRAQCLQPHLIAGRQNLVLEYLPPGLQVFLWVIGAQVLSYSETVQD